MDKREALIELSGQIINGMLSADSSLWSKIADRSLHAGTASSTVNLAIQIFNKIEEHCKNENNKEI